MGWTAAILEMIIYSTEDMIRILPALPKDWDKGHASNILCRGGYEVSVDWDMNIGEVEVRIIGQKDGDVKMKLPKKIVSSYPDDIKIQEDIISVKIAANAKTTIKIKLNI